MPPLNKSYSLYEGEVTRSARFWNKREPDGWLLYDFCLQMMGVLSTFFSLLAVLRMIS